MSEKNKEILSVTVESELKKSYLDYAMSVIVGRALPDVRDGLKPVHRRVLFAMNELHNDWNKPYKKSARIVGDVIGKYHPHGDSAVYETIVRMAQPFSLRYLLVDGQGNFGSIDGDSAAAMRYTEIRMTRMSHSLLADLEKGTVDFMPNYDGSEMMPAVLPARLPNLLINGSSGIAVGMATNIPPHNLIEVINACLALIEDQNLSIIQLIEYISGPDFPTQGIINGRSGIVQAYQTGRGRIHLRGRVHYEDISQGREAIIITELPYQVNKARLLEKISELVKTKRVEGISGIRDESNKEGIRVVIDLRRGENTDVMLNKLYRYTQLQTTFGVNMVALDNNQPKLLNLKQMLMAFIQHRREVVTRRSIFELAKARNRAHILEGLGIALANIDPMIVMIKASPDPATAKARILEKIWPPGDVAQLVGRVGKEMTRPDWLADEYGLFEDGYHLSEEQTQAILDLRLHRLTGLEQDKIVDEYQLMIDRIKALLEILNNPDRLMAVIKEELEEDKKLFGDERRTEIVEGEYDVSIEDLIPDEKVVVTLSYQGYIKSQLLDTYQAQKRGGKGKLAAATKEEDFVERMITAKSHDTILCFSNLGKVYWLKAYQVPQASRQSKGRPIVNLLSLDSDERINAILPLRGYASDTYIFMATGFGTVKKVSLDHFSRPRANGIRAIDLVEGDKLVAVDLVKDDQEIMLFSNAGKAIRFNHAAVRAMGRTARGVRGIRLKPDQSVIALTITDKDSLILTATVNGYGKCTPIEYYRNTARGGQGVISIQVDSRNGNVVSAKKVKSNDDVMLITDGGTLVRTRVSEISVVGRNAKGVRLIRLSRNEKLISFQPIDYIPEEVEPIDSDSVENSNVSDDAADQNEVND